jgi:hypothetical protein
MEQNIAKIASYIVTSDNHNAIESLIEQAFHELESGKVRQEDLAFITKLSKEPEEYKNDNDITRVLAKMSSVKRLICQDCKRATQAELSSLLSGYYRQYTQSSLGVSIYHIRHLAN